MHRFFLLMFGAQIAAAPLAVAQTTGHAGSHTTSPPAAGAATSADRAAIDHAIATVYPSLVRIFAVTSDQFGGREVKHEIAGSGTIISPDGYVVTNHHVAGRAQRIKCTLSNREEVPADLVGTDPLSDLTVLKLHPATPRTFPAAHFGSSAMLRSGDPVLAMGSPLALSQSVTRGIVSNTEMIMPRFFGDFGAGRLDGEDVGTIVRWIGHDASIYPGNSGGPLVNLSGQIVGINEISLGLGGAIPGDLAKSVVEALIRDGRVHRSWTGLEVQPRLRSMAGPGALAAWVADGSPAAAAGVTAGDMLVRVNDAPVDARFAEELPPVNQLLFSLPIGKPSAFVVRREGKGDVTLMVTPIERPPSASIPSELRQWGLVVSNLTPVEASEAGRKSADGVRIVSVRAGGPSEQAKPPLIRDDVIREIDGQPVHTLADLESRTHAALSADPAKKVNVLVGYDRGLERRLTVVDMGDPTPNVFAPDARKAWVPVTVQSLTPQLADRLGLKGKTGARVTRVLDDKTPLRVGDVILAIDSEPVRASSPNDDDVFATAIRRYPIGATAHLTVSRSGAEVAVPVVLGTTRAQPREMKTYQDLDFDFRARNFAETDRDDPRFEDAADGVIVESVTEGGWAALAHLQGGDLILAVDAHPIHNVDDLAARMKQTAAKRPASAVLEIRRGIRTMFLEVQPTWK